MAKQQQANYAEFPPSHHNLSKIKGIMQKQDETGFTRIKAAAKYGGHTWHEARRDMSKLKFTIFAAMLVSSVPLLLTSIIYFVSPILIGVSEFDNKYLDWGLVGAFLLVAFAATVAIDFGRTLIFRHSKAMYALLAVVSVSLSGLGLAAVAYMYSSADMADIKNQLQDSRTALIQQGAGRSIEEIKAEIDAKSTRYHTKGTNYGRTAYQADRKMLEEELQRAQLANSAGSALDSKNDILKTVDSSNMLGNIVAMIIELNANQGVVLAAILFIFAVEAVIWFITGLIELLEFRINMTEQQYYNACYAADRVAIASEATIQQFDMRLGVFIHTMASTPVDLISRINVPDFQYATTEYAPPAPPAPLSGSQQNEIGADDPKYQKSKNAKTGESIECPQCGKAFTKKTYNHIFCSSKGVGNCKDEYHNDREPARLNARRKF